MSKVKNQHFVPRSYLEYFANKRGDEFRTNVYDKDTHKSFPCNIKGIASARYFYDFPTLEEIKKDAEIREDFEAIAQLEKMEPMDVQTVEKFFTDLEGDFASKLNNIRSRYLMSPNPLGLDEAVSLEERMVISINLAFQAARTRDFRENLFEMSDKFTQHLMTRKLKEQFPEIESEAVKLVRDEKYGGVAHGAFMFDEDFVEIPEVLFQHIWYIGVNGTDTPFITSDNPVVKYPHKKPGNAGFASPGIEIAFPISEKLILILRERSFFEQGFGWLENRFIEMNKEHVEFYNWLQIKQSNRQFYSSNPALIKKLVAKNPDALKRLPKFEIIAGGKKL